MKDFFLCMSAQRVKSQKLLLEAGLTWEWSSENIACDFLQKLSLCCVAGGDGLPCPWSFPCQISADYPLTGGAEANYSLCRKSTTK